MLEQAPAVELRLHPQDVIAGGRSAPRGAARLVVRPTASSGISHFKSEMGFHAQVVTQPPSAGLCAGEAIEILSEDGNIKAVRLTKWWALVDEVVRRRSKALCWRAS